MRWRKVFAPELAKPRDIPGFKVRRIAKQKPGNIFPNTSLKSRSLKGPKHEIFESGFFTQIRDLWLGDLGTGEKN
jgi:hypothetical protein